MSNASKPRGCFICISPYWHRNLHDDKTLEGLKIMSAYELDILPILWRNVLFKNEHFCEHVCHSWLNKSKKLMMISSNGIYRPEPTDFELVHKEAMRLQEMIEGLIDGMKKKNQIRESKDFLLVFAQQSLGKKQRVTWRPSGGKKISGTWFGLAESLIEQYSAHLELEDVHEREMRVIIWKHFILAVVQHLIECSSSSGKIFAKPNRLRLPSIFESRRSRSADPRTLTSTSLNNNTASNNNNHRSQIETIVIPDS